MRLATRLLPPAAALLLIASHASAADRSREGMSGAKVKQLFRVLRPKNTATLARLGAFGQLDVAKLSAARVARGQAPIGALIVDVDETMAPHHGSIPAAAKSQLAGLVAGGVPVAIYSNASEMTSPQRQADLADLRRAGVLVLGGTIASKPNVAGFEQAAAELSAHAAARGITVGKANMAMVGDNYMTDGGAIQAGIAFVKIKPVKTDEAQFRSPLKMFVKRTTQRVLRGYATGVARAYDAVLPGR